MLREVEPEFSESAHDLCEALLICYPDKDLLKRFLRDLWTVEEGRQFANRWRVARLLIEGRTQVDIARELGLSTKTVTAVARFVNGPYSTGGYAEVVNRLEHDSLEKQED